ncbi:HNH endonuclease signature motif containing protein [Labedella phragmitis]|nr:HNH endonuclease signature motif containing protein [Labedella phragmitis]
MGEHEVALRASIARAVDALAAPLHALVPARLSGDDYIQLVEEVESLGRIIDALRLRLAGDAESRSDGPIDTFGALGHASAADGLAALAGISVASATSRIHLGRAVTPSLTITGAETPAPHHHIAAAVEDGALGIEAAGVLVRELDGVARRVSPEILDEAERGLVLLAAGTHEHPPLRVDLVRMQASVFIARIDPDGARPKEQRARRKRRLRFGVETSEGLIPVSGLLAGEVGITLKNLVDAHRRSPTFADPDAADDVDVAVDADPRTLDEKRHDALAAIVGAASRAVDAPDLGGAAPAVIVTVTAEALEEPNGFGVIDGLATPVPVASIERLMDTRGHQIATLSPAGRILSLGSVQRCFIASQRRVITARDGGCIIPGCGIPAGWCEVHHVIPHRAGGPTHVDNGVLLCWGHHQKIDSGPWRISMPGGVPHVRGPGHHEWTYVTKARRWRPPLPATG